MAYGTIKVDTVTFTNDGVDKSITLSGLVQNPTFSGNVTVTGTFSGVTVTGTTASFTSGNFTNISGGTHTITSGVFAAGSAASPSITFTGDLNTGIYSPGADQVAISTAGSGRLFVDASGRVGIGASGPGFPLEVRATSSTGQVQILGSDNTNATWRLATPSSSVVAFGGALTHAVAFGGFDNTTQAFSERLRITSAGLVGIGTSSPGAILHSAVSSGAVVFRGSHNNTGLDMYANDATGEARITSARLGGSGGKFLSFYTDTGTGEFERLRIDSSGRVGIGTTSPSRPLEVNGIIRTTATGTTSDASQAFEIVNSNAGVDPRVLVLSGTNNGSAIIRNASTTAGGIQFQIQGGEVARIDSSGRLLVGTSSARSGVFFNGDALAPTIQLEGTTSSTCYSATRVGDGAGDAIFVFAKARGTTVGSTTVVQSADGLGAITFQGADGSEFVEAARISAAVDGTPGANDMPGRLVFSTTADGASSPTERARITSGGYFKASDNATYVGSTSNYHEFNQSSTPRCVIVKASNASYAEGALTVDITRAANSVYKMFEAYSGSFGDREYELRGDGNAFADGTWTGGGADYAEFFEWADSNPDAEDRRGISVVLDGDKIREAQAGEDPIGVISGNPSVVGDAAWNKWSGKYLRDEFGTYILDENGDRQLNPAYDPDVEYISREQRPEWDCVGLMGKLRIRKGQATGSRWIKMRDISATVEEWLVR
jgi:hypothetical protein